MLELQSLYEINVKEKDRELQKSQNENTSLKISSKKQSLVFLADIAVLVLTICFIVVSRRKNKKQ